MSPGLGRPTAMAASVMWQDGRQYPVKLGSSLLGTSDTAFWTLRYDFKPASVAESGTGILEVDLDSRKVAASILAGHLTSKIALHAHDSTSCSADLAPAAQQGGGRGRPAIPGQARAVQGLPGLHPPV